MNIIDIFTKKHNPEKAEVFLAIEIQESLIKSLAWQIQDNQASIIGHGSFEAWTDEENLINGVNNSISEAVKQLSDLPDRVIFGLPHSWLDGDAIHPTKEPVIKKIVRSLGLAPIGVVTTTQAIVHHLKYKEGVPPSVILLEVYQTKLAVSLVQVGKVVTTEEVGLSGDLCHDIEEALTRIETDNLPPRFILSNDTNPSDESQKITSYHWTDKLPFVHTPKVESLPHDFSIEAIAISGGGEAVIGQISKESPDSDATQTDLSSSSDVSNLSLPDSQSPDLSQLGFSYEQVDPPSSTPSSVDPVISPQSDGQDNTDKLVHAQPIIHTNETDTSSQFAISESGPARAPQSSHISKKSFSIPGYSRLLIVVGVILFLFLGSFAYYYFAGRSMIKIQTNSGVHQSQSTFVFHTSPQADQIPARVTEITTSDTAKAATTGDTNVGEKSKGQINIYNGTSQPISIKAGTSLRPEDSNLVFVLDKDVTVASMSSEFDSILGEEKKTFGRQTEIPITASKIGADYNLSKNTRFIVDNYSRTVMYGILDTDTTGGSSRVVRSANPSDQAQLISSLKSELSKKIQQELKLSPTQDFFTLGDIKVASQKFDKGLGEEATEITLDMTISQSVLIFDTTDLFALFEKSTDNPIKPGYIMDASKIEYVIGDFTNTSDEQVTALISYTAPLLPVVDQDQIISQVRGGLRSKVREFIELTPGYESSSFIVSPNIWPFSSYLIPRNNLTIELTTK
jgi:hypothetical protein